MQRRHLLQAAAVGTLFSTTAQAAADDAPRASVGRIERWAQHPSRHVQPRHVDVWLPPGYDERVREGARFAVLYMHDGQMLFDAARTWNRQAWKIDLAAQAVVAAGGADDVLIVGVWNNGPLRHSEYFPAGFLPHLPAPLRAQFVQQALAGESRSDAYLRFLVEELKPAVDARYATRPGREATRLMGSSMGGLISAYALWEHPGVFGGAACLSTHWIGTFAANTEFPQAALAYLRTKPPAPDSVRLWTDRGTLELDTQYADAHRDVAAGLAGLGFRAPRFRAQVFEGTGHNETHWAARVQAPLKFLLSRDLA
jgi:predicted alpha/beta superfamily hydrolase